MLRGLLRSFSRKDPHAGRTLYEIFLSNRRGDIQKWHHYFDVYETFFAPYRGEPIRLLEIGLLHGGSLRMWRTYFGTSATIYGMDIDPSCAQYEQFADQIFIGSQADRDFLKRVKSDVGEIDIVIDDGGHTMSQQINSFEELYPVTRKLYIVEDTHTSYWPKFRDMGSVSFVDYAKDKVDLLHEWHRDPQSFAVHSIAPERRAQVTPVSAFCASTRAVHFYDSMIVFEKSENAPRWHDLR